jgi:hypothetical protein
MLVKMMGHGKWVGLCIGLVAASGLIAGSQGCKAEDETRFIPDPEGGAPKEGGSGDTGVGPTCPSTTPVDAMGLAWKPPIAPQADRCQDDDIAAMKAYLAANPNATNEDFENFVKNRDRICHDCIFGDADGTLWPPAPVKDNKVVTFNVGACFAIVTGDQECGRAFQNAWDCGFEACLLCTSPDVLATCRANARTGVCRTYEEKARTKCGPPGAADEACGGPFDSIRVQCVNTASPNDAGTD